VPIEVTPSTATTIAHAYVSVAPFFPRARDELATIDEAIVSGALGAPASGKGHLLRGSVRVERRPVV
jgi:hypothetical protein